MTERDAFLKAILADPDDDTPRLVYADWLTEHGEESRAEFIRLTCRPEMPHTTLERVTRGTVGWDITSGPAGVVCAPRMCDAARAVAASLLPFAGEVTIRRGFVHSVTCSGDDWVRHGDAVLAEHPVREVVVTEPADFAVRSDGGWGLAADPEGLAFDHAEIRESVRRWHGDWIAALDAGVVALGLLRLRWPGVTFRPAE